MISGFITEHMRAEAAALGVRAVAPKERLVENLLARVQQALDRAAPPAQGSFSSTR